MKSKAQCLWFKPHEILGIQGKCVKLNKTCIHHLGNELLYPINCDIYIKKHYKEVDVVK